MTRKSFSTGPILKLETLASIDYSNSDKAFTNSISIYPSIIESIIIYRNVNTKIFSNE